MLNVQPVGKQACTFFVIAPMLSGFGIGYSPDPSEYVFFSNEGGIRGWIDRNLENYRNVEKDGEQCPYLFREALHQIWTSKNKRLYDVDDNVATTHIMYHTIFDKVRNIRIA